MLGGSGERVFPVVDQEAGAGIGKRGVYVTVAVFELDFVDEGDLWPLTGGFPTQGSFFWAKLDKGMANRRERMLFMSVKLKEVAGKGLRKSVNKV
jgi:hypothetical protein